MNNVPIKFGANTQRVKSISFHPNRPWLLLGLYDGSIQIWDYRSETLVQTHREGTSPIRCVLWHQTQPMFASCGDDELIRVHNYQTKTSFTLAGHTDYVRFIEFHPTQPWLLSSSDDQTIRIWNWQSRQCIHTILGHHYYVLQARFHPTEPLIASVSLDNTVRIWNYSTLIKNQNGSLLPPHLNPALKGQPKTALDSILPDVEVVAVIDQEAYINACVWYVHPATNISYLFFGGKSGDIKVFTVDPSTFNTYHHDTLRGHTKSLTSLSISSQSDHGELISTSEDGSCRIWQPSNSASGSGSSASYLSYSSSTVPIQRPDDEHCWASDVTLLSGKLVAIGYDTGFSMFKVSRERFGYSIVEHNGKVYWMVARQLITTDLFTGRDESTQKSSKNQLTVNTHSTALIEPPGLNEAQLDPTLVYSSRNGIKISPAPPYVRSFYTNPHNKSHNTSNILFTKGGIYNVLTIQHSSDNTTAQAVDVNSGQARYVAFVTNSRIAVLSKEGELLFLSLTNELKRKITPAQFAKIYQQYAANQDGTTSSYDVTSPHPTKSLLLSPKDGSNGSSSNLAATPQSTTASSAPNDLKQFTPIAVFPAQSGCVLVRIPDYILLFDTNNAQILSDFYLAARLTIKRIIWSADLTQCAICTKTLIYWLSVVDRNGTKILSFVATFAASTRIKSLCFDNTLYGGDVIVFNTATHLKYLMRNGHVGILKTLNDVCYVSTITNIPQDVYSQRLETEQLIKDKQQQKGKRTGDQKKDLISLQQRHHDNLSLLSQYDRYIHLFTRRGKYQVLRINTLEYVFKHALQNRLTEVVANIMYNNLLSGNNVIDYVCEMGYYDLALGLTTDPEHKFQLSLQCGNFHDAVRSARALNLPHIWRKLSKWSLIVGNITACEQGYIATKNLPALAYLYIVTNQREKLRKIIDVCLSQKLIINGHNNTNNNQNKHVQSLFSLGIWLSLYSNQQQIGDTSITSHLLQFIEQNQNSSSHHHLQLASDDVSAMIPLDNKFTSLKLLSFSLQAQSMQSSLGLNPHVNPEFVEAERTKINNQITAHIQNHKEPLQGELTRVDTSFLQRSTDCVANHLLNTDLTSFIASTTSASRPMNSTAGIHFEMDEIEDCIVDSLLNGHNYSYSQQDGHHALPIPEYITPVNVQQQQQQQNGAIDYQTFVNKPLLSPWHYLASQDEASAQHIINQSLQSWPTLTLQQIHQQQQQESVYSKNHRLGSLQQQQDDSQDDWFTSVLSHAEGLARQNYTSMPSTVDTNPHSAVQSPTTQQETWDFDDDIDSNTNTGGGDNFFDEMNDPMVDGQMPIAHGGSGGFMLEAANFLSQPNGEQFILQQNTNVTSPPYFPLSFIGNYNQAMFSLQDQISPYLSQGAFISTAVANPQDPTTFCDNNFVQTTARLTLFNHFYYTAPYTSLNIIDSSLQVNTDNTLVAPPTLYNIPFTYYNNDRKEIDYITPITVGTLDERFKTAVTLLQQAHFQQALVLFRNLLQILPLVSPSLVTSHSADLQLFNGDVTAQQQFLITLPHYCREYILFILIEEKKTAATDPKMKAIWAIILTLTAFNTIPSVNNIYGESSQRMYQAIYDLTQNTLWLACKYLYPLNNFGTIGQFSRKIGTNAHQNPNFTNTVINLETVSKMLKKCQSVQFGEQTPLQIPNTNQPLQYNQLIQTQQQTQNIGSTSFVKQIASGTNVAIPKGLNLLVCSKTFQVIPNQQTLQTQVVSCSYCYASAQKSYMNQRCDVCRLGTLGGINQSGLQ